MTGADAAQPRVNPGAFSDVDQAPKEQQVASIGALDAIAQMPGVRRLKAWALEQMRPDAGMSVLDVGCGTGEDTQGLAVVVAPGGSAIGLDRSEVMIEEARRRAAAAGSAARFRVGDAASLPLPDQSADALRCERVLQHLSDPESAVADMRRVLRPNGRAVLIDTDWRTLSMWPDGGPTGEAVKRSWVDGVVNAAAGAQLPDLLVRAGFEDVAMVGEVLMMRSKLAADVPPLRVFAERAVSTGAAEREAVDTWLAEVRAAAARDGYVAVVTMLAASGVARA